MSERREKISRKINFGLSFSRIQDNRLTQHVVLNVGEGELFTACEIVSVDDKEALSTPGTYDSSDITRTGETWTKERIIKGMEVFYRSPQSQEILDLIEEYSKKNPRYI